MVGSGFTVTTAVAVLLQLFPSVPVTVYVVVVVGFTEIGVPDPPVLHAYVLAPPAVRFFELPIQIVPPPAVTVGNAFMPTATLLIAVQPLISDTLTVYVELAVMVAVGVALIDGAAPVDHA